MSTAAGGRDAAARATVLVVAADAAARAAARLALEPRYEVVEAGDLPAALASLARQPVDLVLLSPAPGLDAQAACGALKGASKEYLPVLLRSPVVDASTGVVPAGAGAPSQAVQPPLVEGPVAPGSPATGVARAEARTSGQAVQPVPAEGPSAPWSPSTGVARAEARNPGQAAQPELVAGAADPASPSAGSGRAGAARGATSLGPGSSARGDSARRATRVGPAEAARPGSPAPGAEADGVLLEPVDGRELAARVAAFLRLGRQERLIAQLGAQAAAKEDLISLLVHDLRNPLAAVLSSLRFLAQEVGGTEAAEDARIATDSAEKVNELLDDVVQVRLLEEGTAALAPELASAGAVVREATEPLRPMAAERRVTLEVNATPDVTATLDRRLVRRAVQNLVTNALKYTRKRVQVDVVAWGAGVEVRVADQGLGVPDDVKAVLFEKYGTVHGRSASARRGVGVGLYLVRLVAVAHGGEVTVEDREGGGTVLRLRLGSLP